MEDLNFANKIISLVEKSIKNPQKAKDNNLLIGVDLGTAYITIVVLDKNYNPLGCQMEFANVVRDGLVVDFNGAIKTVTRIKKALETSLQIELTNTCIAVPPGTFGRNRDTHRYVVEAAGFQVLSIIDEPTAANKVLNIKNGAVVDIGGGTTGIAIFKDGEVIYTADEPTGGTHFTLVIAGRNKISFEEAEKLKTNKDNYKLVTSIVLPVIQKVASIIKKHIKQYDVNTLYIVGGTSCLPGIENIISNEIGIKTIKPYNPLLVTPIGIALSCNDI